MKGINLLLLGLLISHIGCSKKSSDLKSYVEDIESKSHIESLPFITYSQLTPVPYQASSLRSPFSYSLLGSDNTVVEPELRCSLSNDSENSKRLPVAVKQPILRGTFRQRGKVTALVEDATGRLYRLQVGDRFGDHSGEVLHISEQYIEVEEWVEKGADCQLKRLKRLTLTGLQEDKEHRL